MLVPFYAGARISEIVASDVDDVARSARKGFLRILGKGERVRELPSTRSCTPPRTAGSPRAPTGPGPTTAPPCALTNAANASAPAVRITSSPAIAGTAGLEDDTIVHVLRHTFATTLVRGGTDLVIVAELLGHARLETTRGYTRPSAEDRTRALDLLLVDE